VPEKGIKKLVLGGCRSGKSRHAEQWASDNFQQKTYVATLSRQGDAEMDRRIDLHRESRGNGWQLVEEPRDIVAVLAPARAQNEVVLLDCLTMWITNLMMAELTDPQIEDEILRLKQTVASANYGIVLVANEVGLGLVPESAMGRRFRDLAGWCNQQMAEVCDQVVMVAAGLPLTLKG